MGEKEQERCVVSAAAAAAAALVFPTLTFQVLSMKMFKQFDAGRSVGVLLHFDPEVVSQVAQETCCLWWWWWVVVVVVVGAGGSKTMTSLNGSARQHKVRW